MKEKSYDEAKAKAGVARAEANASKGMGVLAKKAEADRLEREAARLEREMKSAAERSKKAQDASASADQASRAANEQESAARSGLSLKEVSAARQEIERQLHLAERDADRAARHKKANDRRQAKRDLREKWREARRGEKTAEGKRHQRRMAAIAADAYRRATRDAAREAARAEAKAEREFDATLAGEAKVLPPESYKRWRIQVAGQHAAAVSWAAAQSKAALAHVTETGSGKPDAASVKQRAAEHAAAAADATRKGNLGAAAEARSKARGFAGKMAAAAYAVAGQTRDAAASAERALKAAGKDADPEKVAAAKQAIKDAIKAAAKCDKEGKRADRASHPGSGSAADAAAATAAAADAAIASDEATQRLAELMKGVMDSLASEEKPETPPTPNPADGGPTPPAPAPKQPADQVPPKPPEPWPPAVPAVCTGYVPCPRDHNPCDLPGQICKGCSWEAPPVSIGVQKAKSPGDAAIPQDSADTHAPEARKEPEPGDEGAPRGQRPPDQVTAAPTDDCKDRLAKLDAKFAAERAAARMKAAEALGILRAAQGGRSATGQAASFLRGFSLSNALSDSEGRARDVAAGLSQQDASALAAGAVRAAMAAGAALSAKYCAELGNCPPSSKEGFARCREWERMADLLEAAAAHGGDGGGGGGGGGGGSPASNAQRFREKNRKVVADAIRALLNRVADMLRAAGASAVADQLVRNAEVLANDTAGPIVDVLAGLVYGAYDEDPTLGSLVGQTLAGFSPADDARSVMHALEKIAQGDASVLDYAELVAAGVGAIPILGDLVKGLFKVVTRGADDAVAVVQDVTKLADDAKVRRFAASEVEDRARSALKRFDDLRARDSAARASAGGLQGHGSGRDVARAPGQGGGPHVAPGAGEAAGTPPVKPSEAGAVPAGATPKKPGSGETFAESVPEKTTTDPPPGQGGGPGGGTPPPGSPPASQRPPDVATPPSTPSQAGRSPVPSVPELDFDRDLVDIDAPAQHAVDSDAARILRENKRAGAAAEKLVENRLNLSKDAGVAQVFDQVWVNTSGGRAGRKIDLLIQTESGDWIAVEVKHGAAERTAEQVAKDEAIAAGAGQFGGRRAPSDLRGTFHSIETVIVHVDDYTRGSAASLTVRPGSSSSAGSTAIVKRILGVP